MLSWGWRIPFLASGAAAGGLVHPRQGRRIARLRAHARTGRQGRGAGAGGAAPLSTRSADRCRRPAGRSDLVLHRGHLRWPTPPARWASRAPPCWTPPSGARRWRCSPCRCVACWATASVSRIFMAGAAGILLFAPMFSRCCRRAIRHRHDGDRRGGGPGLRRAVRPARRPVLGPVPARGALQRHLAGGAGVGRHRRRTGAAGRHVAAGLRRRRPALHCLVPERAGPGRHRQRASCTGPRASRCRPAPAWRPAHETVAPRLLLLAEFRLGLPGRRPPGGSRGARTWPSTTSRSTCPTSTRAPAACCWASARGNDRTTASPSCAAGAASWASRSTRTPPICARTPTRPRAS